MYHSSYSFTYVHGTGLSRMMRLNDIETLDTSRPATTICVHVFAVVLFALAAAVGHRLQHIETLDISRPVTTICVHVFALVLFTLVPAD